MRLVFALYGILQVINPNYVTPSCQRDVVDIFTEAAVSTMAKQKDLRMLYYAFKLQREFVYSRFDWAESQILLSWVPVLALPLNRACKITLYTIVRHKTTINLRPVYWFIDDQKLLHVRGCFRGVVEDRLSQPMPKFRTLNFQFTAVTDSPGQSSPH